MFRKSPSHSFADQTAHGTKLVSAATYAIGTCSAKANLTMRRIICWNSRVVVMATFHPEMYGSSQQLRAFSTVLFSQAEGKPSRLRPHSELLCSTRAHSWRRNNDKSDIPPLQRSKTAYYDILRVSPNATQSQIKTAYYKQSFIYHPDKNPGHDEATVRFSEISEAYSVLGSIPLRRKYDHGILSGSDIRGARAPPGREAGTRASGSQQHRQHQRSRQFSNIGGKTLFDFDAFYQAHYGEQLQREKARKAQKARHQQKQQQAYEQWKLGKMMEVTVVVLLTSGFVIFFNIRKS